MPNPDTKAITRNSRPTATAGAIALRRMRPADHSKIVRLWKASPGVHVGVGDDRAGLIRYLRRNPGTSFITVCGGRIVGAILAGHDGRRGYLHHLAVDGRFRRMGIGSMLVEASLKALQACGLTRSVIFVIKGDKGRTAFWKRAGFTAYSDVLFMATDYNKRFSRAGRKSTSRPGQKRK